jgi:hypothetical protein
MLAVWLPVFLFPMTLAYLIVVRRALDVRVVVRQSVQYLLAKNTARFLQVVFMAVVIFGPAFLATDPENMRNHPQRIAMVAEGIVGMLVVQRVAERLRRWIDRRFFREAYNAELLLSDLAEKVRTIVETRPLLETVARRISEPLHITKMPCYCRKLPASFNLPTRWVTWKHQSPAFQKAARWFGNFNGRIESRCIRMMKHRGCTTQTSAKTSFGRCRTSNHKFCFHWR